MKKTILPFITLMLSLSVNAQKVYTNTIEVYENDGTEPVATYENTSTKKYRVELKTNTSWAEHEYVDLGLPSGTLWAKTNIGAETETDYGLYFAWGETTGYTSDTSDGRSFDWASYKWCDGSGATLTKYCNSSDYGKVDGNTKLESSDDAATVFWGDNWCIPSSTQTQELIDNTIHSWTTINGVYGYKFANKNHQSIYIFLPAAGTRYDSTIDYVGSNGCYWSNGLYTSQSRLIGDIAFSNLGNLGAYYSERFYGRSVRPVRK